MAEKYLAGHPTVPCSICDKPTPMLGTKLCDPCWQLKQRVENYLPLLLANPVAAPRIRELIARVLATKPTAPEAA